MTKPAVTIRPHFRLTRGRQFIFGPGKAELLEHLERTGSLTQAAQAMEMSYMRAWKHVKGMEQGFAEPLVKLTRGGRTRGGAALTPTGRAVLRAYRDLEAAATPALRAAEKRFAALLARRPRA